MPPIVELAVAILDSLAFFLVAPEIIGKARVTRWFQNTGRCHRWVREVAFNRDQAPLNIGSFFTQSLPIFVLMILLAFGIQVPSRFYLLIYIFPVIVSGLFVFGYIGYSAAIWMRVARRS